MGLYLYQDIYMLCPEGGFPHPRKVCRPTLGARVDTPVHQSSKLCTIVTLRCHFQNSKSHSEKNNAFSLATKTKLYKVMSLR